jgi:hypothetical protein
MTTTRPRKKCGICKDPKAIAWIEALLEEGFSPRRISRAKQAGYGFSRPQVVRHINECRDKLEDQERSVDD